MRGARFLVIDAITASMMVFCSCAWADEDRTKSLAAYDIVSAVLHHPRCMNCHTKDYPRQGDDQRRHDQRVARGEGKDTPRGNTGVPTLQCGTCHQSANSWDGVVPGAPGWALAPTGFVWEGKSDAAICRVVLEHVHTEQSKRAALVDHMTTPLVAWAWSPGKRSPPNVTQATFLAAIGDWIDNGAACPSDAKSP